MNNRSTENIFPRRLGSFRSSTWGIVEDFTEEEYLDSFHRRFDPVPNTFKAIRKPIELVLPDNLVSHDCHILRTREHEWTHFRQHISTHLGVFIHRLCGIREYAAVNYFRSLSESSFKYKLMPFRLSLHSLSCRIGELSEEEKYQLSMLNLWASSDYVEGALWCKTMYMKDLIKSWNLTTSVMWVAEKQLRARKTSFSKLDTKRSLLEHSCPGGHITVQQLIEGFAKYREFIFLAAVHSPDVAIKHVLPTTRGVYEDASLYIYEHLGIPPYHPFSGAIQEAAVLCFIDPILGSEDSILYWEDIHPGLKFEAALKKLSKAQRTLPTNPIDAYEEALRIFDIDNPTRKSIQYSWLENTENNDMPISLCSFENKMTAEQVGSQYFKSTFIQAARFRRDHPAIYFEPQSAPNEVKSDFASLTRPPFIVRPDKVFFPHGLGRDLSVGLVCLMAAFTTEALEDLAREAELPNFNQLLIKANKLDSSLNTDWAKEFLLALCGRCLEPYLNKLLEKL